jgi:hypothetical protein
MAGTSAPCRLPTDWSAIAILLVLLAGLPPMLVTEGLAESGPQTCQLPDDPRVVEFRIERLDRETQCLLARVINSHTTTGTMGPIQTAITQELYEFMLDRPVVTAALVDRLGIGTYRFTESGPRRFWVDDGDGTQGLLTPVYQDGPFRIYHVEGFHQGHVFSMVRAMAVVFLTLQPGPEQSTNASIVAFVRLNDPVLAGIVWMLRPLLEGVFTRKVTRGFEVTHQLGQRIAQEPDRILHEIDSLPFQDQEDANRFRSLVASIPTSTPAHQPAPHPVPPPAPAP